MMQLCSRSKGVDGRICRRVVFYGLEMCGLELKLQGTLGSVGSVPGIANGKCKGPEVRLRLMLEW